MFKIKTNKETLELSKEQLLQILIEKITTSEKPDHQILAETMANYLELNGVLKNSNPLQLLTTAFSAGYFYRIFLQKNDVQIEAQDADPTDKVDS